MADSPDLVLVTGLSGFVAKHVALRFAQAGYRIRGTVRSLEKGEGARRALVAAGCSADRIELAVADLTNDEGWAEAVRGCRFVAHTASPFPAAPPRDKFALVAPARDGTLRVVEAAKKAGVERMVLTSSVVAVYHGHDGRADQRFSETDFSNVESDRISSYAVSKTLAEQAAWTAVEDASLQLSVINPAFVLGPLLDKEAGTSVELIAMMMRGLLPVVPGARFGIVDVRDVAEAHFQAVMRSDAAGRRFIASAGMMTLLEIGQAIGEAYPPLRSRLPRFRIPDAVVRLAGRASRRAALLTAELDADRSLDNAAARQVLGLNFRPPNEAVAATAESVVRFGLVHDPASPQQGSRKE